MIGFFIIFFMEVSAVAKPQRDACQRREGESSQQAARFWANAAEEFQRRERRLFSVPSDHEAKMYTAVVNCDPTFRGIPWARLSRWASTKGFTLASDAFLQKARELSPRSLETMMAEAQGFLSERKYDSAFRVCSNLLKELQDPKHILKADALLCAGASGLEANDVDVARLALTELEPLMENHESISPEALSQVYFDLGRAWEMGTDKVRYGNGSDLQKAMDYFSKALRNSYSNSWALFHRALIFAHENKFQEAFNENEEFLKAYPRYAVAIYNKACFLLRLGDKEGGLKTLEKAFHAGFRDRNHVLKDTDLNSIRDDPRFQVLLSELPIIPHN